MVKEIMESKAAMAKGEKCQDDVKKRPRQVASIRGKRTIGKSLPILKRLSKARKLSGMHKTGNQGKHLNVARRLALGKKDDGRKVIVRRKKSIKEMYDPDDRDTEKPSFYRTRNAATVAYEEKLRAVRAASRSETMEKRKQSRSSAKKEAVIENKADEVSEPAYEAINESRILSCGLWFRVGDVISVYGNEQAQNKVYYGQILLFLKDWIGEYYCRIRWLIPISLQKLAEEENFDGFRRFNFNNYLEGPIHADLINLRNINFVTHPPFGPGTVIPGTTMHYQRNSSWAVYRILNETRILDVPTSTATSVDPRYRNPFI